jgi:hypothetical protein
MVERRLIVASDPEHQPSDRVRRPATVVEQLVPTLVAVRANILPERAQEVFEEADRQPADPDGVREREKDRPMVDPVTRCLLWCRATIDRPISDRRVHRALKPLAP